MTTSVDVVVRFNEAFNAHDAAALGALMADDMETTAPGGVVCTGRAECVAFELGWLDAFPDARVTIEMRHVAASSVIEEGIFTGTHKGVLHTPNGDIEPTGRSVRGEYVAVYTVEGDRLTAERLIFDRLELLEQLGVVPAPAATT